MDLEQDPLFYKTDPRIRIHFKMKRIRNTALIYYKRDFLRNVINFKALVCKNCWFKNRWFKNRFQEIFKIITVEEKAVFREAFSKFDNDGNGQISTKVGFSPHFDEKLSSYISLSFIIVWWRQRVVTLLSCGMGKISKITTRALITKGFCYTGTFFKSKLTLLKTPFVFDCLSWKL